MPGFGRDVDVRKMRQIALVMVMISALTGSWAFAGTVDLERAKKAARAAAGNLPTLLDERTEKTLESVSRRIGELNEKVANRDLPHLPGVTRKLSGNEKGKSQVPGKVYYLMISRSVPEDTLRTYAGQAKRLKGHVVFVLRGFIEGPHALGPTVKFYLALARKNREGSIEHGNIRPLDFQVDPFRFGEIERVPALSDGQDCIVYGDAPLPHLAEKLEEKRCGERFGAVFEVIEENGLSQLKDAVASLDQESLENEFEDRVTASLTHLPGADLPGSDSNDTVTITPSYTLPFDVPDPETGEVLYPAGYTYNPLEYLPAGPGFSILVVNGDRPAELKWLNENRGRFEHVTVSAIGGNAFEMSRIVGRPVFSGRAVAETGWCPGTPCLVTRDGTKLKVRTWRVEDQAH